MWLHFPLLLLWGVFCLVCTVWAYGAIYFDGPMARGPGNKSLAIAWVVMMTVSMLFTRGVRGRSLAWMVCFACVLLPWLVIRPSNERDWQQDWRKTGWADSDGDTVMFHNFRNFDYAPGGEVTERWETRTVDLSNLRALDVFLDKFGGDLIAHPIASFDFGPDGFVALSVETRREKGESYSEFGGLYKMFELQYVFGDERDLVRVRTNVRKEPVYLYRVKIPPERLHQRFHDCVKVLNELHDRPRFYNVLTANCTTSLRAQTPKGRRMPFDSRMLANGKLDELAYEWGSIETGGLPFPKLQEQARINELAQVAHADPAFSTRIREGRAGFTLLKGTTNVGLSDTVRYP